MSLSAASPCNHDQSGWRCEQTYADLPSNLYAEVPPARVREPELVLLNLPLARQLGLDFERLSPECLARLFAGQELPPGCRTIAQAYAGHQFGHFTMLGDGRALLLGEQRTPDGQLVDIQFKGSGRTPFSRGGDGRAALGPMLREYIISEAIQALGIPTTRSLAVVTTGEPVYRSEVLAGAILTRTAASHLRVGTFQFVAALRDREALRKLADYAIARHLPEAREAARPCLEFYRQVALRQARLIARWQLVGFVHGVMNTDNMAISGETIDYGPCAFMDRYDPGTVFSSIDDHGRYAYGNQPQIGKWNLARLAEALLPLLDEDPQRAIDLAMEVLEEYSREIGAEWLAGMRAKLWLRTADDGDESLVEDLLAWMHEHQADYTNTFDDLSAAGANDVAPYEDEAFRAWHARWQQRLAAEGQTPGERSRFMQSVNPAVIPRNHRVEEALEAATREGDLSVLRRLLEVLQAPYVRRSDTQIYRDPPPVGSCPYRTFCGT